MVGNILRVEGLRSYPIKSMGALELNKTEIRLDGGFVGDRAFWFEFEDRQVLNGKQAIKVGHRALFQLICDFDHGAKKVCFSGRKVTSHDPEYSSPNTSVKYPKGTARALIPEFKRIFGQEVFLCTDKDAYRPDDTSAPGPTIMTVATANAMVDRFGSKDAKVPGMSLDEAIARMRPNILVDGAKLRPFEEFSWVGKLITINGVRFEATNINGRCPVIGANPFTGEYDPGFLKAFGVWVLEQGFINLAPEGHRRQPEDGKKGVGTFCAVNTRLHGELPLIHIIVVNSEVIISEIPG